MKRSCLILLCYSINTFCFQKVDINKADKDQVALLPGISLGLAQNIVIYREKNGFFKNSQDLLKVKGLNEKKLDNIKDLLVFNQKDLKIKEQTDNLFNKKVLPSLTKLEEMALKKAQVTIDIEKEYMKRARLKALLPKLAFLTDFDSDKGSQEKKVLEKEDAVTSKNNFKTGFGVRATFELSNLIFNDSEIEIAKIALKKSEEREKIISKLHFHYFRYKKLQNEREKEKDSTLWPSLDIELEEHLALVEYLCGTSL